MRLWIESSLNRKFNFAMASGLLAISILFLVVFIGMYRKQLEQDRAQAAAEVNHLLQSALENAMLKRDLDGLREIVKRLGKQTEIVKVMILNPQGYVRFASNTQDLGENLNEAIVSDQPFAAADGSPPQESTQFIVNEQGKNVLRSVNPVRNKTPCNQCHGPVNKNPINGVLFVDYAAEPILKSAWDTALTLTVFGVLVVLLAVFGGWLFMRRYVLSPVDQLVQASRALSTGQLKTRVQLRGNDELAQLGKVFNEMAQSLQESLRVIHEKEAFLQGLIDSIPDGIRVVDSNYAIVKANQTYRAQLQQELNDIENAKCYESSHNRTQPCPPTMLKCPIHEIMKVEEPLKTIHQHIRKDGSRFYVEVFAAPMKTRVAGQSQLFFVESIRDMAKAINFSQQQKLATMGQLAAGVAHEIRNPLAAIRLALQSTLRVAEDNGADFNSVSKYLRRVDDQIDKCIDVTERLLKLSGSAEGQPQLVSLNSVIEETLSLLLHDAERRGIDVKYELATPEVRIIGADSEIRMLVFNFVENAFHAMPKGGCLHISARRDAGKAIMVCQDSGVGIAPEEFPQIFDPFFSHRADGSEGTGLGLSICKSVVDRYSGQIEVDSRVGEGTRFTVMLPDADARN